MLSLHSANAKAWNSFRPIIFKLSFCISLLFAWAVINTNFKKVEIAEFEIGPLEEPIFSLETPITREKKKEVPPPSPPKKKIDPPVLIEPVDKIEKTAVEPDPIFESEELIENNFPSDTVYTQLSEPAPKIEIPVEKEEEGLVVFAEQMPIFGDCDPYSLSAKEVKECSDRALLSFIQTNLKYPSYARSVGIEGTVVVQFVVFKNGSIGEVKVLRDIGGGCGQESQAIINNLPDWLPGKQNGRPVSVLYTVPIKFDLR